MNGKLWEDKEGQEEEPLPPQTEYENDLLEGKFCVGGEPRRVTIANGDKFKVISHGEACDTSVTVPPGGEVQLFVPVAWKGEINIEGGGSLDVKNADLSNVNLEYTGDCKLDDVHCQNVQGEGSIDATGLIARRVYMETSGGKVVLRGCTLSSRFSANTMSGRVNVENCTIGSDWHVNTMSGRVTIDHVKGEGEGSVETMSGSVQLNGPHTVSFVNTMSGSLYGQGKEVRFRTMSGQRSYTIK